MKLLALTVFLLSLVPEPAQAQKTNFSFVREFSLSVITNFGNPLIVPKGEAACLSHPLSEDFLWLIDYNNEDPQGFRFGCQDHINAKTAGKGEFTRGKFANPRTRLDQFGQCRFAADRICYYRLP